MVSKQFIDEEDVKRTIEENLFWRDLSKAEMKKNLKEMLSTNRSLTAKARKYLRAMIRSLR